MRHTFIATTLALSLASTTAMADSNAPAMQMDEQMIVKEMSHEGTSFGAALPIILMILLAIVAAGAKDAPAMMYAVDA